MTTQHFSSSIVKLTTEGERVISSFLADGERLLSDVAEEIRGNAEDRGENVPEPTATAASTEHDALGIEPQQDPTAADPAQDESEVAAHEEAPAPVEEPAPAVEEPAPAVEEPAPAAEAPAFETE